MPNHLCGLFNGQPCCLKVNIHDENGQLSLFDMTNCSKNPEKRGLKILSENEEVQKELKIKNSKDDSEIEIYGSVEDVDKLETSLKERNVSAKRLMKKMHDL